MKLGGEITIKCPPGKRVTTRTYSGISCKLLCWDNSSTIRRFCPVTHDRRSFVLLRRLQLNVGTIDHWTVKQDLREQCSFVKVNLVADEIC